MARSGGHAKETLAQHTSKHLVARWLRSGLSGASIVVDSDEVENGQRPDVLLTLEDGAGLPTRSSARP